MVLQGLHILAEHIERAGTFSEWDDPGEEGLHVQAFFLIDANGWNHRVPAEVQAEDAGGPAGYVVRDDVQAGRQSMPKAKGSTLPPGVMHLERMPGGITGCFDDDACFAPAGEICDLLDNIHLV
jgi:hypothetical protein